MQERVDMNTSRVYAAMATVATVVLAYLTGGAFLFTLPFLLTGRRFGRTSTYVGMQATAYLASVVVLLLPYRGFFNSPNWGIIGFSAIYPLIISLEALIYSGMRDRSRSFLRKIVKASVPAFVIGGLFAVWLTSPAGSESYDVLQSSIVLTFESMFAELGMSGELEALASAILPMGLYLTVPLSMILGALPIVISEFMNNSLSEQWNDDIANMKLPDKYFWFFLASLVLVVPELFVKDYSRTLSIVGMNFLLGISLHYAVNGFSIVVSFFRKRIVYFHARRLIFPMILLSFFPGLNFVMVGGLVMLGIMENWLILR